MKPRVSRSLRLAPVFAMVVGIMVAAGPAQAGRCSGSASSSISLEGFVLGSQPPYFYMASEAADGEFYIGGSIDPGTTTVTYDTPPGSPFPATVGADYTRVSDTLEFVNPPANNVDCDRVDAVVQVPITNDATVGEGVEEVLAKLTSSSAGLGTREAPLYILDNEGAMYARIPDPAVTSKAEPLSASSPSVVQVPVLRGGTDAGTINYSISPTTDVAAPHSGTVQFTGGLGIIRVSILHDTVDEPSPDPVTVTITPSGGAAVQGDNTFLINILDNDSPDGGGGGGDDDNIAPTARFHHPKHGARYRQGAFLADTIHLYTDDNLGHTHVTNAQAALRKKMTNGNCKWWQAGAWRSGSCAGVKWFEITTRYADQGRFLYIYTAYPSLQPSVGTRIANYRVYGRAIDDSGNRSPLRTGDNRNTFEVTRR